MLATSRMAQWKGQFSGRTHETTVQDIKDSLRLAIETYRTASRAEHARKLNVVRRLAQRLLAARLKALRARITVLTQPGSRIFDATKVAHLRRREQDLRAQDADDILREFDV